MNNASQTWFVLPLGDGLTSAMTLDSIEVAFARDYPTQSARAGAAVFKRFDSSHSLHCEVSAYFSPAAATLATQFNALPCAQPVRSGLELLAGKDSSWSTLFP